MNIENLFVKYAEAHHHRVGLFGTEEEHLEFERIEKESMQEIIKELEASIRKEVEDKLMRAWDDMEHKGIKFCENDDWRNYKFVRNSIRDIIKE